MVSVSLWTASRSLPSRGAWIEIFRRAARVACAAPSLPSRGAWIEMLIARRARGLCHVAPLAGSVDRNL